MKTRTFTAEDFETFKQAVEAWMTKLNITGWRCEVRHEQVGDNMSATVSYNQRAKIALFRLSETVEFDFGSVNEPERLALHEVLHLLIADVVTEAAKLGDDMCDAVVSREHEVIHRLMGALK